MKILIDTNVALDVLLKRSDFYAASYDVLKQAALGNVTAFITANAVTDIYYIVRRQAKDNATAKYAIERLLKLVAIADVTAVDIASACTSDMHDFEDAVVAAVAKRIKAECIVTRNEKDFARLSVSAMSPKEFMEKYAQ